MKGKRNEKKRYQSGMMLSLSTWVIYFSIV